MKIIKYIISVVITAGFALSCNFLDMEPNIIIKETYYNNETELKYGLAGVYGALSNEAFYGNYYSLMLSNVDDLSYFNRPTTPASCQVYKHDAGSSQIYDAWTEIYAGIKNANAYMSAIEKSAIDKGHRYYSEARFLRAYYHFILAQAWGDVPLRKSEAESHDDVMCAATPQAEVLKWVAEEMKACIANAGDNVEVQPSRVTKTTMQGILARVYLFMAGETVRTDGDKKALFKAAMDCADSVIVSGKHKLNPDYTDIFKNMMSNKYDTGYRESMWEVEFYGDRSSASSWTNGRIGDLLGLQSSGSKNYSIFKCNYAYGQYNGSLKLWDLYWKEDRTDSEKSLPNVTDKRQEWNMSPYNYAGNATQPPYGTDGSNGKKSCDASIDKTPYVYDKVSTTVNPLSAAGIRNCGKFRREVEYEGVMSAKSLYTKINYPILRYADVLLMYAEAQNEYEGAPSQKAYDCVKAVRDRAGIATNDFSAYDKESFRSLVRNERGRELCFESLRKYDLIRWGVFVKTMNDYSLWAKDKRWVKDVKSAQAVAIGTAVEKRHVLLPIPSVELGVNNLLRQNSLW